MSVDRVSSKRSQADLNSDIRMEVPELSDYDQVQSIAQHKSRHKMNSWLASNKITLGRTASIQATGSAKKRHLNSS